MPHRMPLGSHNSGRSSNFSWLISMIPITATSPSVRSSRIHCATASNTAFSAPGKSQGIGVQCSPSTSSGLSL